MKEKDEKHIQIVEYYFRVKFINKAGTESEVGLWAIDKDTATLRATKYIQIPSILQVECQDRIQTRVFKYKY